MSYDSGGDRVMYNFNEEQKTNILRIYPSIEEYINFDIRRRRDNECFNIINRGQVWYDTLTEDQIKELSEWYKLWLEAPKTLEIPPKPEWLH